MNIVEIKKEQPKEARNIMNECWTCKHRRAVPGNAHILCANPDQEMKGEMHGIVNGWFNYPWCFDPVWKTRLCNNYEEKE